MHTYKFGVHYTAIFAELRVRQIKKEYILRITSLKIDIVQYTHLLQKAFFQLNWDMDRYLDHYLHLHRPDDSFIVRWIEYFQVKFRMYYLMMTIRVK